MQIAAVPGVVAAPANMGVPVLTIAGIDRTSNQATPMTVFTRATIGRYDGYGSLNTALSAARNLSRGSDKSAVVVERGATGSYHVREAVWRYLFGRAAKPDSAPFRHFDFEDGTFSSYTAWQAGRRISIATQDYYRSTDGVTRWLVDGSSVLEVTPQGGDGR